MDSKIDDKLKAFMCEDVFSQYKPVYYLSKCLLIGPPSFRKHENPSVAHLIAMLALAATYLYTIYLGFKDIATFHVMGESLIALNMNRAVLFLNTILIQVALESMRKHRGVSFLLLKAVKSFDSSCFNYFGKTVNTNGKCSRNIRVMFVHIAITQFFLIAEVVYSTTMYGKVQGYNICFVLGFMLRQSVVLQYVAILNFCYWRFKHLNSIIVDFNRFSGKGLIICDTKVDWYRLQSIKNTITMVRLLHEDLCAICRELINKFGMYQCIGIITGLLEELAQSYGIFVNIISMDDYSTTFAFLTIMRSVGYIYVVAMTQFYFVFYFCDVVKTESLRSGYLILRYYLMAHNRGKLMEAVKLFALQVKQTELNFSAVGIFELNWALMSDIVNEVTSYLVFFIQSSGFIFAVNTDFDPTKKKGSY